MAYEMKLLKKGEKHMSTISWLHISDLHFQRSQSYDSNIVLKSLLDDIKEILDEESLNLDLILISGDIAYHGVQEEYSIADEFFEKLLQITSVPKENLFLVPGNHDVDRKVNPTIIKGLKTQLIDRNSINDFLIHEECEVVKKRFKNYNDFAKEYIPYNLNNLFYTKILMLMVSL